MLSARKLIITIMVALGVALVSTALAFGAGLAVFHYLIYIAIVSGVAVIAVGLAGLMVGKVDDDLRR